MSKNIAVLVSGLMRNKISYLLDVINNIKTQFSFIEKVDIYFQTWESTEKYPYKEEDLNKIKENVFYVLVIPFPDKLNENEYLNIVDTEKFSFNVFCMLYGIGILCDHLQTKYDYVCRWRNDLFLKDDLKVSNEKN